jgi:predicted phosphodiesterase
MLRIGVISDTHGLLRPQVERCLVGVAHIVHAGDIGSPDVVAGLHRIAPVVAIKRNVDTGDLRPLASARIETIRGCSISIREVLGRGVSTCLSLWRLWI